MIKNVIFDWSGTLCDDRGAVRIAINAVLRHFGAPEIQGNRFFEEFFLPYTEFYRKQLGEACPSVEEIEAKFAELFPHAENQCPPGAIPGAAEFLEHCHQWGLRLFLLTSVGRFQFESQAAPAGINPVAFEGIYAGVRDKTEAMRKLLTDHGLDPSQTMMVGDMRHDIEAAKASGVYTLAVLTGYEKAPLLAGAEPDALFQDLAAASRLFAPVFSNLKR